MSNTFLQGFLPRLLYLRLSLFRLLTCYSRVTILFLNLLFSFSKVWQFKHTKSSSITSSFETFTSFEITVSVTEVVVISLTLWQRLIWGAERTRTWKGHFFGALFFWFNWGCNRVSNGLKQNKSVVIVCYKERSSGHWQMASVLYISLVLPFF